MSGSQPRKSATSGRPQRRRQSWMRSSSDSFGPIKQVGVSVAMGLPLLVVGVLMVALLIVSLVGTSTSLWLLAAGLLVVGLLAALSHRIL
jgi:hypothetical protein